MSKLEKLNIDKSWQDILEPWVEFKEGNLKQILQYLKGLEVAGKTICPADKYNIFRAFSLPKNKVRVVWLLQDPYPNPRLTNGIALSVPKGEMSPSLEAVKDELFNYIPDFTIDDRFDETLELWTEQGILMLNSALTCQAFQPKSHTEMWYPFISHVIKELNKETGLIFVFSGKVAQTFSKYVTGNNHVIKTYRPAADKHKSYKDEKLFVGNDLFKQIDDIIEKTNGSEFKIKWLKDEST
jgi:uracil-DNA glycosylase